MNLPDLLPHAGAMCLLDRVLGWDAAHISCAARSHLDPGNPLRRAGRLGIVCAAEYAMQATAIHGSLRAGAPGAPGFVATLRDVRFGADRLDDPAHGTLLVAATLENEAAAGSSYRLHVASESGRTLLAGRATIVIPGS